MSVEREQAIREHVIHDEDHERNRVKLQGLYGRVAEAQNRTVIEHCAGVRALDVGAGYGNLTRAAIDAELECIGIEIDDEKNAKGELDIGVGKVKVLVVPTNEELAIARDTKRVLEQAKMQKEPPVPQEPTAEVERTLSADERVELIALWMESPNASMKQLATKMSQKTGRDVTDRAVKHELTRMGFDRVSKDKKAELLARDA